MGRGGNEHYMTKMGFECLLLGWIFVPDAVEHGSTMMSWLANPIAFVAVVLLLFRCNAGALVFGAVSLVVGALYPIAPPGRSSEHPDLPQIGAWIWLCSLLALTVAALIRCVGSQAEPVAAEGLPS